MHHETSLCICFHLWHPDGRLGTLVGGFGFATSWCDLQLIFDIVVVTWTFKILSGLYLGNYKV